MKKGLGIREWGLVRFVRLPAPAALRRRDPFPIPGPQSLVPLFFAAALSACVSVLPDAPPPSARFTVSDVTVDTAAEIATWTLGVEEPEATLAYNSAKIAISRAPGRIEYYAGGEWVDRAPRLFGVALVRSFENTGVIKGVGSRLTLPVSDYVLQADIRRLGVTHGGGDKRAEVTVFARLTNGRSLIHASKLFSAAVPVGADTPDAAAAALDAGLSAIQREIVAWTLEEAGRGPLAAQK